jgi:hypothetical protein
VAVLLLFDTGQWTPAQTVAITRALEVVAIVLLMHAAAVRFWNYALYYAAITAAVLILLDLPQPSN